jgi:hypothetical protein
MFITLHPVSGLVAWQWDPKTINEWVVVKLLLLLSIAITTHPLILSNLQTDTSENKSPAASMPPKKKLIPHTVR